MKLPSSLDWSRSVPGGSEWLERLPRLASECAEEWRLVLGEPLAGGMAALVLSVVRADGERAVLKLGFPDDESEHEGAALRHWGGVGTVRLLGHDPARRALLLEWCDPGTHLWSVTDDEEAVRIAASVLQALHAAAPADEPFLPLSVASARWAEALPVAWEAQGRPFGRPVLDEALAACRDLGVPDRTVLLHQDLHGGNVIRSARGWLAIDPKPLVGDPAFDAASLLRDRRPELAEEAVDLARIRRRLDVLHDELGLDRERMRLWGVVHALAWGISPGSTEADMIRCAELLHRA